MAPQLTTNYLKHLFEPAGSAFVAFLFWIIFQFVFKMDFKCPCDPKENIHVCTVYMTCPAISLFILVMITDKHMRSIFGRNGPGKIYKCIIILMSFIKAFSVANLWIIAVLMDGDWYACVTTTNYDLPPYEQIFCKLKKNPAEVAEIRVQKSLSREIAIVVVFGVSVLWAITSVRQSHCKRPLAYQYNKYFLEKAELYMTEELKKMAEDNTKTSVQEQIRDVRSVLQLSSSQPDIPETQQQQEGNLGTLQATSQAASDQANQENLDQSSDSCTISSEHVLETADNLPLLHGKSKKAV